MTNVIYVCTTTDGKVTETRSYYEAQAIKEAGGSYTIRYEENKTY